MSSYGLWLSATGMMVNDHRQTLLSNNLANANTTGFKHDLAVIRQRPLEGLENPGDARFSMALLNGLSGGASVLPTFHNFEQGPIERTGQPLDVAIDGEGFFVVSDGNVTRYTRDGEFTRNATGELVLAAGEGRWRVLSQENTTIELNETGGPVSVGGDGTIRQGDLEVAKLGLMKPENPRLLRKIGENLFEPQGTAMQSVEARLVPESREQSNFDVMRGLASMIEASRAYQLNATLIQLQDQMTGQAVSRVAQVA